MLPATFHDIFKREAFIPLLTNSKRPKNTKSYDRHRTLSRKQQKQWNKSLKLYRANREDYERDEREDEEKITILAYWSFVDPYIEQLTENCGGCWYTNDRNLEKMADAIVFDNTRSTTAQKDGDMPDFSSRNLDSQYWIWWPRESAAKGLNRKSKFNIVKDENNWDGCMNLTLSYRQDSDIIRPFGTIERVFEEQYFLTNNLRGKELMDLIMKKKMSKNHTAWLVSNCNQTQGSITRWEFGKRLVDAGLKLDGFGKCFGNIIDSMSTDARLGSHKFYLAFENAFHCTDYISEKFWRNSLSTMTVPVVFGPEKEDVEKIAPKNSFIFAEDFETPKDLVDFLDYLDGNDTAYLQFHQWRNAAPEIEHKEYIHHSESGGTNFAEMMCNMCEELKTRKKLGFPKKIINSTTSWWWRTVKDESCYWGHTMPDWLLEFPPQTMENAYDEMKLDHTFSTIK